MVIMNDADKKRSARGGHYYEASAPSLYSKNVSDLNFATVGVFLSFFFVLRAPSTDTSPAQEAKSSAQRPLS